MTENPVDAAEQIVHHVDSAVAHLTEAYSLARTLRESNPADRRAAAAALPKLGMTYESRSGQLLFLAADVRSEIDLVSDSIDHGLAK